MSQLPGMTSFRLIFSFRLIKSNYSLRYMNIFTLKNLIASAHASALLFQTGSEPVDFLDFKPRSHRASGPEPLLSRTPRSVWDCKGKNLSFLCKIYLTFFLACFLDPKRPSVALKNAVKTQ